jgi:hypothetical protein
MNSYTQPLYDFGLQVTNDEQEILPYPFNDLNTDARDCADGCACLTYAGIELGCVECREVVRNPRHAASYRKGTASLECPECGADIAEWSN